MSIINPIFDGENAGEAFEKVNRAMARTDLTNSTRLLTKNRFGRFKTITLTEDTTFQISMELECEWDAVRIGIPNIATTEVPGVRVAVSVFDSWVGPNYQHSAYPPFGWRANTFEGNISATLPARLAEEVPSITFFDVFPRPSVPRVDVPGARPILAIRVQYPTGSKVTVPYNEFYGWRSDPGVATMRVSKQNVLGVDTYLNYDNQSSIDTGAVIPIVQYSARRAGRQVMAIGDSTTEGIGPNTRCNGAAQRLCYNLSTLDSPVEFYNAGIHGAGIVKYIEQLRHLNLVNPTVLLYQPYTINDTPTGGMNQNSFDQHYTGMYRVADAVRKATRPPHLILLEGLPCNPGFRDTGAGDQLRRDLNERIRQFTGAIVPDYASVFTGERDVDGQDLIAEGLSNDNVHPNESGSEVLANALEPIIEEL